LSPAGRARLHGAGIARQCGEEPGSKPALARGNLSDLEKELSHRGARYTLRRIVTESAAATGHSVGAPITSWC